jgi:hypothetical protein
VQSPPHRSRGRARRRQHPRGGGFWRPRVVATAVVVIAVLIAGGIIAAVITLTRPHHPTRPPPSKPPAASAPPNTGPFTGVYRADLGPKTRIDGQPLQGETPAGETWAIRSVCRPSGCVATAARTSGQTGLVSTLVFDQLDGRWLAVGRGSYTCRNTSGEAWGVIMLQPRPDGTFSGEYTVTTGNSCGHKRTVTFTRTGDVDVTSLLDPASLPPRVVSPAEALHGHYHETITFASSYPGYDYDYAVRTDCLRSGDRCMSFFYDPNTATPLVFGGGEWIEDHEYDTACPTGGTSHVKTLVHYPMPSPPQDPITLLTGHGRQDESGSTCTGGDMDAKFVRTGD